MTTFEDNKEFSGVPSPLGWLYQELDSRQRRTSDETEHEKIVFLMRHIRDGSSGDWLERQTAIVEGRKPRRRVAAKTEVAL